MHNTFWDSVTVFHEEVTVKQPRCGGCSRRKELAQIFGFHCSPTIREIEQNGVQLERVDSLCVPGPVIVFWQILLRDEASVEQNKLAARTGEVLKGGKQPSEKARTVTVRAETRCDLAPQRVMNAGRKIASQ